MSRKCLYCYAPLGNETGEFHAGCSEKIFGTPTPPALEYSSDEMLELAQSIIKSQTTVTGVQPKLSLGLTETSGPHEHKKLTIPGVMGNYILKPPTQHYPHLPELEDLTMHLAALSGIRTVPHTLIRLRSGELAYLTRRIDRDERGKIHMEDFCQLLEKQTEAKYRGSYEQVGKAIFKYSSNPGLDIVNLFEVIVFGFLTGNNDMHLKNFSMIDDPDLGYILCPSYDLLASELVVEGDDDELALTLNGKRRKLKKQDFEEAFSKFRMGPKPLDNIFIKMKESFPVWKEVTRQSFLPDHLKTAYLEMVQHKASQIGL